MDVEAGKEVCATCEDWQGPREWTEEGRVCRVSPSARGQCARAKKVKTSQGGCKEWRRTSPKD
jgi:hypothetical protein